MAQLILKKLTQSYLKQTESRTKILIFAILDTLQLKKIGDYENIYCVNPLYMMIGEVDGHIEENNGNKYLVFHSAELRSTDENEKVLEKYTGLWYGIKNETETINGGKIGEYGKYFMKIKFNMDDNLPLNQPLKLHLLTIIFRCILEEDNKFYL